MATRRVEQFVRANSYSYSSGLTLDLINSANALMRAMAVELQPGMASSPESYASRFAPGAIVLAVTAFEMFLNGILVGQTDRSDAEVQEDLNRSTIGKVDFLSSMFATICSLRSDLQILVDVRNEIVHHFPRPGRAAENFPAWYTDLERRGLFITTGNPDADFDLGQKLGSSRLALWSCIVVATTVSELLGNSLHTIAQMNAFEAENFQGILSGVQVPSSLA